MQGVAHNFIRDLSIPRFRQTVAFWNQSPIDIEG